MKKIIILSCMATMLLFSSCTKTNPQSTKPTFSFTIGPVNTATGATATITDRNCTYVSGVSVTSNGKTVISVVGTLNGGAIVSVSIAIEGSGKGIYSQHPTVSMDGTDVYLSRGPEYGFSTDEDHNVSVELTRFDGVGGMVSGTINANAHHLVDGNTGESEQLNVTGSFSVPRSY